MAVTYRERMLKSEGRLERLMAERLQPGADKERVDQRIWDLFGERWAVMYTDLSGFSRRVAEFGVIHFLQTIYESFQLHAPVIDRHGGFLLKVEGDSLMVIFRNVNEALECAVEMQRVTNRHNAARSAAEKVLLCVGIGYGEMLRIGEGDVFGAEVNAASKLGEDTAKEWEILVTGAVRDAAKLPPGCSFEPIDFVPPGAKAAFKLIYPL
ncbi:MAG: adenylate/guanylate cyclase domain-containing protein [Betaproteobacteria bacterium]|nr:adenylate/guanylate cyclase domain-containing protein [Betaproteobacteria bacterium]